MSRNSKEILFEKIYRDFRDPIYRTCCMYLKDPDERYDLMQDILLNIWRGLDDLKNPGALKTWIYRISNNTALGKVIKQKKEDKHLNSLYNSQAEIISPQAPDEIAYHQNRLEAMMSCIRQLPDQERLLIGLVLEELDTREMADITGLSEVNVRVRIHRAKKKLKELMEKESYGLE